MEKNLTTSFVGGGACTKPAKPGPVNWTHPEHIDAQMAAFIDLTSMSLACELTHVVAFQFGSEAARNRLASKYGIPSSPVTDSGDSGPAHHPWTHRGNGEPGKALALQTFTTFYAEKLALLIDKLKTTIDASGKPLLDSTVVLWV